MNPLSYDMGQRGGKIQQEARNYGVFNCNKITNFVERYGTLESTSFDYRQEEKLVVDEVKTLKYEFNSMNSIENTTINIFFNGCGCFLFTKLL